ncbi:hypothetical protein BB8028_0002g06640 [Beauveria bassiana]|uniref:Uncharacterized protein n=1 Tax=Beauveria bassiana TaxID=176275 RepID=A0A2S7Y392_BEABA|nr:hypothetical protein BB8028_0002g06640 [Beauveria bassiana]
MAKSSVHDYARMFAHITPVPITRSLALQFLHPSQHSTRSVASANCPDSDAAMWYQHCWIEVTSTV